MFNCPCMDCCNRYRLAKEEVHIHLLYRGIMWSYTFWYLHGQKDSGDEVSDRVSCDKELCEVEMENVDKLIDMI